MKNRRVNKQVAMIFIAFLMLTATILPFPIAAQEEISVFNDLANYDPPPIGHRNYFVGANYLPHMHWVLESLTHYFQNNGTYVPGIAEEWELSEDYLTFTLKLREGVMLHDGTEFTTKDVEATFYCLYPRMDRPWYFISEIEVVDDYNMIFHQSEKTDRVQFYVLWHYQYVPYSQYGQFSDRVKAKIAEGYDIFSNPEEFEDIKNELFDYRPDEAIGTGPYKEQSIAETEIVLEKHEDFWNGVPPIDEIHIKNVKSPDVAWSLRLAGEVDWMWETPTPEQLDELETKPFAELIKIARPMGPAIYFNHRIFPLNVKEVRQAIAHAMNRTELAYIQYPIGGVPEEYITGGSSAYLPVVVNQSFMDEYVTNFRYEYDLGQAEEILDDLGYTKGADGIYVTPNGTRLEFELLSAGDWLVAEATEAIAAMLEQVGIKCNVRIIDPGVMAAPEGPFYQGNYEICAFFGIGGHAFIFEEALIKYNLVYPGCGFPVMQSVPWLPEPVNVSALTQRISLFPAEVTQTELNEIYAILVYVWGDQLPAIGLFTRPVIIMLNKQKFAGWPSPEDAIYWNSLSSYAAHGRSYLFRWFMLKPLLQLTVSVEPSEGGTISPTAGTYSYMKGETVTFTATAASGYNFDAWELDGVQVSTSTTYAVTMDTSHTLEAAFSSIPVPPPPYELYAAAIVIVVVVIVVAVYFLRK